MAARRDDVTKNKPKVGVEVDGERGKDEVRFWGSRPRLWPGLCEGKVFCGWVPPRAFFARGHSVVRKGEAVVRLDYGKDGKSLTVTYQSGK
jgi:hypothetical protein